MNNHGGSAPGRGTAAGRTGPVTDVQFCVTMFLILQGHKRDGAGCQFCAGDLSLSRSIDRCCYLVVVVTRRVLSQSQAANKAVSLASDPGPGPGPTGRPHEVRSAAADVSGCENGSGSELVWGRGIWSCCDGWQRSSARPDLTERQPGHTSLSSDAPVLLLLSFTVIQPPFFSSSFCSPTNYAYQRCRWYTCLDRVLLKK